MELDDFPPQPFRVRDAETFGLTGAEVRAAAREGVLDRVARGVYQRADIVDDVATRARVVACAVAAHHVAVDRTAAWLHGVEMLTLDEQVLPPPIESCALRGKDPSRRPELDGRTRDLAPGDIMTLGDVRATTPLRTALDLGCHLRQREAFAAMCLLARRHAFTARDLVRELPRFRGRRGVVQLRVLAPLVDPRVESHREAWTLLEIIGACLPTPTPQWWVEIDGVPTYRLDFAYPLARVCVEYDGFDHHLRIPDQREYDERRRRWLRENGWTVIVIRKGDFADGASARWTRELHEALRPSYTNRRW